MEELIPIVMFLCIAGVMIFRPITKRLGLLLEALARERTTPQSGAPRLDEVQMERITTALERLNTRMDLMDDRIGFMERLVEGQPGRRRLSS